MKPLLLAFIFVSTVSFAQENSVCDILKSKSVSFRSHNSNDILEISVSGNSCLEAALRITLKTEQGSLIYNYESDYKRHFVLYGDEEEFGHRALRHVEKMVMHAIRPSSKLPDSSYVCFSGEGNCNYVEHSTLSLGQYKQIKSLNVPVLFHSTNHECGFAYIFDAGSKNAVKILEWCPWNAP